MIESANNAQAECEVDSEGEIDSECLAESVTNAYELVMSVYKMEVPTYHDMVGTIATLSSIIAPVGVPQVLEAATVLVEKMEKGEPIDATAIFDAAKAASGINAAFAAIMQIAQLCKEIGQLGLTAAGRKWDLGFDKSCWLQTRPRKFEDPGAGNACPAGLTFDAKHAKCLADCTLGGVAAGLVCQGKCPKGTTLHGSICVDNDLDPETFPDSAKWITEVQSFGEKVSYDTMSQAILQGEGTKAADKKNLESNASSTWSAMSMEAVIMAASESKKLALTRCKMYTP